MSVPQPDAEHWHRIDEAARSLGIDLLPWQRDVGQRILNGETVITVGGRRAGRATLKRVIDKAREGDGEPVETTEHEIANQEES